MAHNQNNSIEHLNIPNWRSLCKWTEQLENDHAPLTITGSVHTIQTNNVFRLDEQVGITVHGRQWINLQVQQGTQTIFTVFVDFLSLSKGKITDRTIYQALSKGAFNRIPQTTVYYGISNQQPQAHPKTGQPVNRTLEIAIREAFSSPNTVNTADIRA